MKKIINKMLFSIVLMSILFVGISVQAYAAVIFCKTESGKHISLEVELTDSIESVREKIEEKEGIDSRLILLTFKDEILEDGYVLEDYNIGKDSTIILTTKSNVVAVESLADMNVEFGASLPDLPSSVSVTMDDNLENDMDVIWDVASYNGNQSGTYTLEGTLVMTSTDANINNIVPTINVIVEEEVKEPNDYDALEEDGQEDVLEEDGQEDEQETDSIEGASVPKTSDTSEVILWMLGMIIAVSGIMLVEAHKRRI